MGGGVARDPLYLEGSIDQGVDIVEAFIELAELHHSVE
jgi:hypothetical protein